MITTVNDFAQEIATELFVLEYAVPLLPLVSREATWNLTTRKARIFPASIVNDAAVWELRDRFLPLLFAAAWKVLDFAIELSMAQNGISKPRLLISDKVSYAGSPLRFTGISLDADVAAGLAAVYRKTEQTRHSLIHRQVHVDPITHALTGVNASKAPLRAFSQDEQMAFCRAMQMLAAIVSSGGADRRAQVSISGQLSLLSAHLPGLSFAAPVTKEPFRVAVDLDATGRLNVPALLAEAKLANPKATFFDIEVNLPDGKVLEGRLDEAPSQVDVVTLAAVPPWLTFKLP